MTEGVGNAPFERGQQRQIPDVHAPRVALVVEIVRAVDVGGQQQPANDGHHRLTPVDRQRKTQRQDAQQPVLDVDTPDAPPVIDILLQESPNIALQRHVEPVMGERVRRVPGRGHIAHVVLGQQDVHRRV